MISWLVCWLVGKDSNSLQGGWAFLLNSIFERGTHIMGSERLFLTLGGDRRTPTTESPNKMDTFFTYTLVVNSLYLQIISDRTSYCQYSNSTKSV